MPPQILLVDDDDACRDALAMVLEAEGYAPAHARNGREAFERLAGGLRPSLIVLDDMMPEMDGESFRRTQKSRPDLASIPVVLFSASEREAQRRIGADAVIPKPADADEVLATIARYVVGDAR